MPDIGKIQQREITDEMRESYLDYAMSVIVARALPDVRDGLKPVHRRILYTMHEMGLSHGAKFRKSAAIVGQALAQYHPHGDIAVYDSLARMAQDFSLRYPLVDGQGNWGNIDGDSAAAMRYCVTGDTLVATGKGLLPIDQLSKDSSENIELSILSKNQKINAASKWFNSGEHPTLKMTTARGLSLQGSYNHPILTLTRHPLTGTPKFEWKLLSRLKIGDMAVIDRTTDILWPSQKLNLKPYWPKMSGRAEIKILPKELDEDLAHIMGALLAEATVNKREIEFCNADENWIHEFEARWQRIFPDCRLHKFSRRPNSYGKKPYQTLEIHSQHIVSFLRNLGIVPVKSAYRTLPHAVLRSPKAVMAEFLRAYFEGDGSISSSSKMVELSCISKSEKLISELQTLFLRFGIVGTKRFDGHRATHKLYLRGLEQYLTFQREIGFVSNHKSVKLTEVITKLKKEYSQTDFVPFLSDFVRSHLGAAWKKNEIVLKHNFDRYPALQRNYSNVLAAVKTQSKTEVGILLDEFLANHYFFDAVAKIEDGGIRKVYSIRVDSECHSFVANGFVNHNTESRMTRIAEELLRDIEKDTVDFRDNYDGTRREPQVLPAALPNLLLNGTLGIAVGMATNIPPHNLGETADALAHLIDHPKATQEDLMEFVKGPDFPTGGLIFDEKEIRAAYAAGKGAILNRGKAEIEEGPKNSSQIVISEIPYQVNKSELIETMANLVQEKRIEGIRDIRDESDKDGLRIVIELKQDAHPQKVLNNLYKHTDLEKNFHLNLLALVEGIQPQVLSLKEVLELFLKHRNEVVIRRTKFDLARAKERIHILEGLKKALDHIDRVIDTIKKSRDKEDAHAQLVKKFSLSDIQATAILEMRLQTLAGLERQKIEDELKEKKAYALTLEALLRDPKKIMETIKKEILEMKEKFGDERKTKVARSSPKEFSEEDLIADEEVVVVLTRGGYIKRLKPESYRMQKRGGKGLMGIETKEEDMVVHLLTCNTHANLLFFTNYGKVYQVRAYEIPEGTRVSKGKAIFNFLSLNQQEQVNSILAIEKDKGKKIKDKSGNDYVVMITKDGIIKKVEASLFENVRRSGLIAITLKNGDVLRWAKLTGGQDELVLVTQKGQSVRFSEKDVRPMGRTAAGVHAMRLKKGDEVIGMDVIGKEQSADSGANRKLLVVMENGYGKQTLIKQFKKQRRGGSGIKCVKITPKTGGAVGAEIVDEEFEELIAISRKGQVIRVALATIPTLGRATQGVRIMRMDPGDAVASITTL